MTGWTREKNSDSGTRIDWMRLRRATTIPSWTAQPTIGRLRTGATVLMTDVPFGRAWLGLVFLPRQHGR